MAATPVYQSTPYLGVAAGISTANTNRDGTGTLVEAQVNGAASLAPAAGRRITRLRVLGTSDPADCIVTMFIVDAAGSPVVRWNRDIDIGNPAAGSATIEAWQTEVLINDLVLPAGHTLRFGVTVAPTAGTITVWVMGGELT